MAGRGKGERPGIGAISALAFALVLVPGIVVYAVLSVLGLSIGAAGLLGLFVMVICVGVYPIVLRRLGWVGRR